MKDIIKAEPYRIKMVEPIKMNTRAEREKLIKKVGYNQFALRSEDVYIDLLTDSGTGAMSDYQWAGIMLGDESYAGSRNYYNLKDCVKTLFGYDYIIPTHQGRGAENVLFHVLIKPGQYVLGNMHFDTTKTHIELKHGRAVNLAADISYDTQADHPFKGNIDIEKLVKFIEENGKENIAFILMTITCNSAGGQPVSMENIRETREVADRYGIPMFFDAARFAENAYFIKKREKDYKDKTIREIAMEMFSYGDGCTVSAKKDGLVNIGGFIALNDEKLYRLASQVVVAYEGFPTYGGLAGRDMEALARGLQEVVEIDYLESRIDQIEYLGQKLREAGIAISEPVGGHAVFVDVKRFLSHIPQEHFPGQALCVELYLEAGVRGVEIGTVLAGRDPETGKNIYPELELVRLTIPRRVYTYRHMDVVAQALANIYDRRESVKGLRFTYEPPILRHFTAEFEPIDF